jgi:hypothetical protein
MKYLLLIGLGLWLSPLGLEAGEPPPAPAVVTNSAGEKLAHPQIIAFDGESFQVAHDGGVAAVPWASMPEVMRQGYQYDPAKAGRLRQVREIRRQVAADEAQADGDGQEFAEVEATPEATSDPTPIVIERDIRLNDRIIMSTIGGPAGTLQIRRISQTEITFARDRYESQTVERKLGFNEPRTLLFSDGRGCDVYWVERIDPNRDRWSTTIQFEYAPNAASRPR